MSSIETGSLRSTELYQLYHIMRTHTKIGPEQTRHFPHHQESPFTEFVSVEEPQPLLIPVNKHGYEDQLPNCPELASRLSMGGEG